MFMLAIIGPRWSELLANRGSDPADFVTIELKAAFTMGKRIIPVLVGHAPMPRADELPEANLERGTVPAPGAVTSSVAQNRGTLLPLDNSFMDEPCADNARKFWRLLGAHIDVRDNLGAIAQGHLNAGFYCVVGW
jgi:hypothetical protein